jgi:hypothetical protein
VREECIEIRVKYGIIREAVVLELKKDLLLGKNYLRFSLIQIRVASGTAREIKRVCLRGNLFSNLVYGHGAFRQVWSAQCRSL